MTRFAAMQAAALFLAACSGKDADYNKVEVPEREAAAQNAIDAAVAQNGVASTARAGVPVAKPPQNAARDRAFMKEMQGYWGRTPNDCELANTAATGRIDVEADTIRFYESKARVTDVVVRDRYAMTVDLRFSGEGETWRRRTQFRLENGGTALIRAEDGAAPVRYQRC